MQRRIAQCPAKVRYEPIRESVAHSQSLSLQHNIEVSWYRLLPRVPYPLHKFNPQSVDIALTQTQVKAIIHDEQQRVSERRLSTFKEKLIQDWNSSRKQTYAWLKDTDPYMTPCFRTNSHEYATKHKELHQMMLDSWKPIFNRYHEKDPPSYQSFRNQFPMATFPDCQYDADRPFSVPEITAKMIADVVSQLKPSSPGIDGWQVHELKALGLSSFQKLAMLYHIIEHAATWPSNLLEVPVTTLKKGSGQTPLQIRPISLTSHIYRVWAKRRWSHLQPWHLAWVPKELHGGIANRETLDSYFQVALDIEQSSFDQHPLFGILHVIIKNVLIILLGLSNRESCVT